MCQMSSGQVVFWTYPGHFFWWFWGRNNPTPFTFITLMRPTSDVFFLFYRYLFMYSLLFENDLQNFFLLYYNENLEIQFAALNKINCLILYWYWGEIWLICSWHIWWNLPWDSGHGRLPPTVPSLFGSARRQACCQFGKMKSSLRSATRSLFYGLVL